MKKTKSWGFDIKDMDPKVRPQDDFYHHSSGGWLKRNTIPKDESRWGSFIILRKDTDIKLHKILSDIEKRRSVKSGGIEQLVRDLYRSATDIKTRTKLGIKPLAPYRKIITDIVDRKDLLPTIAELHKKGIGSFWDLLIEGDWRDSAHYGLYVYQSGLTMPDRDYYLKDDAESTRVRTAYISHVERVWKLAGYSPTEAKRRREIVLALETRMAKASMTKEDTRDVDKIYHKMSVRDLSRRTPQINWSKYLKTQGYKGKDLIVMQPDFLREVNDILAKAPLEDLKVYLEWHLIDGYASYLLKRISPSMAQRCPAPK